MLILKMLETENLQEHCADLFTSNLAKELIAKHIDSYLHCLSVFPE